MGDFFDKNSNTQNNKQQQQQGDGNPTKIYFWIAVACLAVGAVLFGVSFTGLGNYALFACMICQLASITFLNVQKKHNYFLACKVVRVASYAVMLAAAAIIFGAIVIDTTSKS
jgi:hypothetical protein